MFYVHICPKCGYTRKSNIKNHVKCEECGANYIKTTMESKQYINAWLDNDLDLLNNLNQQLYNKFVFNSAEYDENLFNERQNQESLEQQQATLTQMNINNLSCPKCHSTAITTGNRGFSIWTGFFGSGATVNRCGNCGHKWKPRG